jgi:hypothetical protein
MGYGSWSAKSYVSKSVARGMSVSADGLLDFSGSAQELYKSRYLDPALDPKGVIRECRDSEEHPETIPVILALDVTGSMGSAAVEVAKTLNVVMTKLYDAVKDVQFLTMGIGDLAYDRAPIQASQFESDIRISEQLDKLYFEAGGGGNKYESYTAAWYFGLYHTDLDCWKRGQKGIIITMGDETLNPYLPCADLNRVTGDTNQTGVETKDLYPKAAEKFDIYHLNVSHYGPTYNDYFQECLTTFQEYLGERARTVKTEEVADAIIQIVKDNVASRTSLVPTPTSAVHTDENGYIVW